MKQNWMMMEVYNQGEEHNRKDWGGKYQNHPEWDVDTVGGNERGSAWLIQERKLEKPSEDQHFLDEGEERHPQTGMWGRECRHEGNWWGQWWWKYHAGQKRKGWGQLTTIIIYCLVSIYCVLRYVYSTYVYLVLVRSNVYYGANSDMGVRILWHQNNCRITHNL